MRVIRSQETRGASKSLKERLLQRLIAEWSGSGDTDRPSAAEAPVIFEIDRAGLCHVIVVWNKWDTLPWSTREEVILSAHRQVGEQRPAKGKSRPKTIVLAIGATVSEAIRNGLLPYSVRETEVNESFDSEMLKKIRDAKINHGAIPLSGGEVALAFPTRKQAENILKALQKELPKVEWSLDPKEEDPFD